MTVVPPCWNGLTTGRVPEPRFRDALLRRPRLWFVFLAAVSAMAIVANALAPDLLSAPPASESQS